MGLTSTTTLDEFGGLAHHLSGVQLMVGHHVVAHHHAQRGAVVIVRADDAEQVFGASGLDFEHEVFG